MKTILMSRAFPFDIKKRHHLQKWVYCFRPSCGQFDDAWDLCSLSMHSLVLWLIKYMLLWIHQNRLYYLSCFYHISCHSSYQRSVMNGACGAVPQNNQSIRRYPLSMLVRMYRIPLVQNFHLIENYMYEFLVALVLI